MEREDFIIEVYCLVCELYDEFQSRFCPHGSLRRGGFAPALTGQEVITIELCGESFKQSTDSDIFNYFMAHFRPLFPQLKERTAFVRRAANLWQVKAFIHQRLVQKAGADRDPFQVIDTLAIPVRFRFALIHGAECVTVALEERPIMATAPPKRCIITASNWGCAWPVMA